MKIRLPKNFVAFILWLSVISASAQNPLELSFLAGAKYHPENFSGIFNPPFDRDFDWVTYWPVSGGSVLLHQVLPNDQLNWEAGLSCQHFGFKTETAFRDENNVDLGILTFRYNIQLLGMKAGMGYRFRSQQRKFIFNVTSGLQCHFPLSANAIYEFQNEKIKGPIYLKSNFEKFVYYGLYLRPSLLFNFSNQQRKRLYFGPFIEGDLLVHHKAKQNPKWTAGGGVQVNYVF